VGLFSLDLSKQYEIKKIFTNSKMINSLLTYAKLDCILCMGEGDSFSDIYGLERFKSIDSQHRIARYLRKKYILLPQTIGPFEHDGVKKAARKSLEKASLVLTRDKMSYNYVAENTRQTNVFELIDVAFLMPFKKQVLSDEITHVGINVSSLLWNGGYTRGNQFELTCNYQELVYKMIDYFISFPDVKVHLVPHVVLPDRNIENDYETSYSIIEKYNNDSVILSPFFLTPIMAKSYISGMNFFIGARMHATIAAFSSGVPVFPLAYSRKFIGLFKDSLNYKAVGDLKTNTGDQLMEEIKKAFLNRDELSKMIVLKMDTIVKYKEIELFNRLSCALIK